MCVDILNTPVNQNHDELYWSRREYNQNDSGRNKQTDRRTDHLENEEEHENAVRAATRKGQRENIGKVSVSLQVRSTACQL